MMMMVGQMQGDDTKDVSDVIGKFLSFACKGDRVGLNKMLRDGTSPDVHNYDKRTALHLAASEGHAPIVELLLQYKANVNLKDRWQRTPLTDARLYGYRDICRILERNGGKDFINNQLMTVLHEPDNNDSDFDISELNTQHSSIIEQGVYGNSEKVKWRGTWVVKTVIKREIHHPEKVILSNKDITLVRQLGHPNILQILGSIVHGEEMILITEYFPHGNLNDILTKKIRLDLPTALRYALDIARGMNYLHKHKPLPIVHNHLDPRNLLLQDEAGHLKIGEYWVQMLYEQIHPTQDISQIVIDLKKDIRSFGFILYQMIEGRLLTNLNFDFIHLKSVDCRSPKRIQQLIEQCTSKDPAERPSFGAVIEILEEVLVCIGRAACPVC